MMVNLKASEDRMIVNLKASEDRMMVKLDRLDDKLDEREYTYFLVHVVTASVSGLNSMFVFSNVERAVGGFKKEKENIKKELEAETAAKAAIASICGSVLTVLLIAIGVNLFATMAHAANGSFPDPL